MQKSSDRLFGLFDTKQSESDAERVTNLVILVPKRTETFENILKDRQKTAIGALLKTSLADLCMEQPVVRFTVFTQHQNGSALFHLINVIL